MNKTNAFIGWLIVPLIFICTIKGWSQEPRGLEPSKPAVFEEVKNTYAILIGVSEYEVNPLKYADDDAHLFQRFLLSEAGGSVPEGQIILLLNADFSEIAFLSALKKITKVLTEKDRLILYFAGHGDAKSANNLYLLSKECDPKKSVDHYLNTDALSVFALKGQIKSIVNAGVEVLLVVDACRTGELAGGAQGARLFAEGILSERNGEIMLLSSSPNEYAWENPTLGGGHGVFTYYLVKGLAGASKRTKDGSISHYNLGNYVIEEVRNLTENKQNPMICCEQHRDIVLAKNDPAFFNEINNWGTAAVFGNTQSRGNSGLPMFIGRSKDSLVMEVLVQFEKAIKTSSVLGGQNPEMLLDSMQRLGADSLLMGRCWDLLAQSYLKEGQYLLQGLLDGHDTHSKQRSIDAIDTSYVLADFSSGERFRFELEDPESELQTRYLNIGNAVSKVLAGWGMPDDITNYYLTKFSTLDLYGRKSYKDSLADPYLLCELEERLTLDSNALIFNLAGEIYSSIGKYDQAEVSFGHSIQRAPEWFYPYLNMGELKEKSLQYGEAESWYRQAIKKDTTLAYCFNNLAMNMERQGKLAEAFYYYWAAVAIEPNFKMTYLNFGDYFLRRGNVELANAWYRFAISRFSDFKPAIGRLANSYKKQNTLLTVSEVNDLMSHNGLASLEELVLNSRSEMENQPIKKESTQSVDSRTKDVSHPLLGKMVFIEGGDFNMGCLRRDTICEPTEGPAHPVKLDDFYLCESEVTRRQWRIIMGYVHTSESRGESYLDYCDECPVTMVSWDEIQLFLTRLNTFSAPATYRLPTEAEWEYAARGGRFQTGYLYAGSDQINEVGWYNDNAGDPKTVKKRMPNELGLYDMSGNVWEWCADWYGGYTYHTSRVDVNPKGPVSGVDKVCRGGSWADSPDFCRSSSRFGFPPDYKDEMRGFRLARSR